MNYKIKRKMLYFFMFLAISSLFITLFLLGVREGYKMNKSSSSSIEMEGNYTNCSNLDIITTSECLHSEVMKFFKYNISNWKKSLSIEQLKTEGGVCQHYADWYYQQILNLTRFNAKEVIIDINDTVSHEFTVMSNDDAYCVLDQSAYYCSRFGGKE